MGWVNSEFRCRRGIRSGDELGVDGEERYRRGHNGHLSATSTICCCLRRRRRRRKRGSFPDRRVLNGNETLVVRVAQYAKIADA